MVQRVVIECESVLIEQPKAEVFSIITKAMVGKGKVEKMTIVTSDMSFKDLQISATQKEDLIRYALAKVRDRRLPIGEQPNIPMSSILTVRQAQDYILGT